MHGQITLTVDEMDGQIIRTTISLERVRLYGCDVPYEYDGNGHRLCMKCGEVTINHPQGPNMFYKNRQACWWYLEEPRVDDWLYLLQIMDK